MAQSRREELEEILKGLDGVNNAYFQPPPTVQIPPGAYIIYNRDDSYVAFADNVKYWRKKRYQVIVVDRNPDSLIPDLVEELPYSKFDRFYVANGLNHFAFNLFF